VCVCAGRSRKQKQQRDKGNRMFRKKIILCSLRSKNAAQCNDGDHSPSQFHGHIHAEATAKKKPNSSQFISGVCMKTLPKLNTRSPAKNLLLFHSLYMYIKASKRYKLIIAEHRCIKVSHWTRSWTSYILFQATDFQQLFQTKITYAFLLSQSELHVQSIVSVFI
jgi:hypothetical protein